MKGIELPINILIIIAVAVIVLIAVVAMFYPAFSGGGGTVSSDVAKSAACQILVSRQGCTNSAITTSGITISNFDADKSGGFNPGIATGNSCPTIGSVGPPIVATSSDNLYMLCQCYYSVSGDAACKNLCGC
jgi:hypothetical protein